MSFEFPLTINILKLVAVFSRIGAFIFAFPFMQGGNVSVKMKVTLALSISVLIFPVLPTQWNTWAIGLNVWSLTSVLISEVLLGVTVSLFLGLVFEIFKFGGFVVDRSMGFMMARAVDPASGSNLTVFSGLLFQSFLMIFLIFNGHHEVIRLGVASFETIGPGQFFIEHDVKEAFIAICNQMFVFGLKIGLPVFVATLLMNVSMGLMARVGQDFPVLMLSFPLRIGLGMIIMISGFPIFMSICRVVNNNLIEWVAFLVKYQF